MKTLSIDIETFSDVDLKKCGVYRYVESPLFEILLFSFSVDEGPITLVDLSQGEEIPNIILKAISEDEVIKTAFNANFERVSLMKYLSLKFKRRIYLNPSSWHCSAVQAAMLGLPLHLEGVAEVLALEIQKMKEGKNLIRYFCSPCQKTKTNAGRTRNLPSDAPEMWESFKVYNKRDVAVELALREKLNNYKIPKKEQRLYALDQKINDKGLLVDMSLVKQAMACDKEFSKVVRKKAYTLTGLDNPNSVTQLKKWLGERGLIVESLSQKNVKALLETTKGQLAEALKLRLLMAKTSVKKYEAIERAVCEDGRVHGLFQFYGANRTGRFAGRLVQFQNLPQNHLKDLFLARSIVKDRGFEDLEMLFGNTPKVLSELIRTTFVPKKNHKLIVADFSAIEARVLSWIAGERWRLEVFESHGKIYEASAAQMFHVPIEKITKGSELRQKGKISELACIAEGALVLTNKGLVPIELVTLSHKLWDGEEWVNHDGVIYKGMKEVIEYEGLRATRNHLVWVKGQSKPIQFGKAATSGAYLLQTGDNRHPVRLGENNHFREKMEQKNESLLCINSMCQLSKYSMDKLWKLKKWPFQRLSKVFTTKKNSPLVRQTINRSKSKMPKRKSSTLPQIRKKRNRISIPVCNGSGTLDSRKCRKCHQRTRNGQNRQQQPLRRRKYSICEEKYQSSQSEFYSINALGPKILALFHRRCEKEIKRRQEPRGNYKRSRRGSFKKTKELEKNRRKVKVYDICNAGKYNRFTVSGKLVHNCGYGGSVGALKAMGALEQGVKETELQGLIDQWRRANPRIVEFWWAVDKAAIEAVKYRKKTQVKGIKFQFRSGILFITLPSNRKLAYVKPKLQLNKFGRQGLTYEGIGTNRKWERMETYGPKIVENIVQAIARDLLTEAMLNLDLKGFSIVAHVHDEIICEEKVSALEENFLVKKVCNIMSINPPWAKTLPLKAEGYACEFYKKD